MTTQDKLNQVAKQLEELNAYNKALKALEVLENVWSTATYNCTVIPNHLNVRLFKSLGINYFARNNRLTAEVSGSATHYRAMDDSQEQPEWRNRAYNAAKIYQDFYNSEFNKHNKYFY